MNMIKRALRLMLLGFLIALALTGVSVTGAMLFNKKEQDYDNEIIKTELVEEQQDDALEDNDME